MQLGFATVFVKPNSKIYHSEFCKGISHAKIVNEVTVELATSLGYNPYCNCLEIDHKLNHTSSNYRKNSEATTSEKSQLRKPDTITDRVEQVADVDSIF